MGDIINNCIASPNYDANHNLVIVKQAPSIETIKQMQAINKIAIALLSVKIFLDFHYLYFTQASLTLGGMYVFHQRNSLYNEIITQAENALQIQLPPKGAILTLEHKVKPAVLVVLFLNTVYLINQIYQPKQRCYISFNGGLGTLIFYRPLDFVLKSIEDLKEKQRDSFQKSPFTNSSPINQRQHPSQQTSPSHIPPAPPLPTTKHPVQNSSPINQRQQPSHHTSPSYIPPAPPLPTTTHPVQNSSPINQRQHPSQQTSPSYIPPAPPLPTTTHPVQNSSPINQRQQPSHQTSPSYIPPAPPLPTTTHPVQNFSPINQYQQRSHQTNPSYPPPLPPKPQPSQNSSPINQRQQPSHQTSPSHIPAAPLLPPTSESDSSSSKKNSHESLIHLPSKSYDIANFLTPPASPSQSQKDLRQPSNLRQVEQPEKENRRSSDPVNNRNSVLKEICKGIQLKRVEPQQQPPPPALTPLQESLKHRREAMAVSDSEEEEINENDSDGSWIDES